MFPFILIAKHINIIIKIIIKCASFETNVSQISK